MTSAKLFYIVIIKPLQEKRMSIGIIVEARLKPETLEEAKQFFIDNLPDTRNFDGNQGISMNLDEDDPTLMFLIEKWESKAHYEKYHHWRESNGSLDQIRSFLARKTKRKFHRNNFRIKL